MTYEALARKSRPKTFASVVGQEPIVTALRNALREDRIASAYLFSGIRGVGKTSVARILAKALNCERGAANGPCNECGFCLSVDSGANLDILEIDAATHSKVEQVRELTENLKYKPVKGRYKVVVLDEVHRLSRQAFDALLKIIEEPPEHLVFIFATTELESVPATILSRCQEFNFRRVPRQALVDHLARLAKAEKITVGDKALRLVARTADGSVRDAVALLDQLATYGSGTIADDEAGRILGGVDAALHQRVLAAMIDGDRATIVDTVREVEDQGWDPRHVFGEFLTYARDALHLSLGGSVEEVELPDEDAASVKDLALRAGYENLLRLLHLLLASEEAVRRSEASLLALEITWLRGAELPRMTQIESLLSGSPPPAQAAPSQQGPPSGSAPEAPSRSAARRSAPVAPPAPPKPAPKTDEPDLQPGPAPVIDLPAEPESSPAAATPSASAAPPSDLRGVERFLELIRLRRQVVAAHLGDVESLDFADGCLTICTASGDTWLELALRRDANREAFESCIEEAFGPGNRWRVAPTKAAAAPPVDTPATPDPVPPTAPPAGTEQPAPAATTESPLDHPRVQAALDVFGGTAEAIDEAGS